MIAGLLVTLVGFPIVGAAAGRVTGGGPRFLLGVGTVGFVLYIAMLIHAPMLPVLIAIPVAAVAVLIFVRRREPMQGSGAPAAATIVTIVPVVFLLFPAGVMPLGDYDGRAFWVLKAKAIADERMIDGPFFRGQHGPNPKNEYPLLIPIAGAAVMTASGTTDDLTIRWLYVLALGSFALHVRRWVGVWIAALLTWLPQFAVEGALSGYNDIFLAAFAGCAFFELVERRSPLRFGIWLSFLVLTKNEGLPFALLLLIAAAVMWQREVAAALSPLAIALATLFTWRARVEPTDDDPLLSLLPTLPDRLERAGPALAGFLSYAVDWNSWGFFWVAVAAAAAVLVLRRDWRSLALPALLIGGMTAVYLTAYIVTTWQLQDHLAASADRLWMHLVGPALYLISRAIPGAASATRLRLSS